MDITTLVSNALSAFAWPATILVVVILFKKEIAIKIRTLTSADIAGVNATFAHVAEEVVNRIPVLKQFHGALSEREKQVAVLMLSGMNHAQIAEILGISEMTVRVYRARILEVTNTNNNAELRAALADKSSA